MNSPPPQQLVLEMSPIGPEMTDNPTDSDPLLGHTPSSSSSSSPSSLEINDEVDIEANSLPCCRICLECDGEHDEELISPCMCKGTQQFVHRTCLDHWRSVKEGFAFSHCTTCKAQFHLRVAEVEDNSWRKMKFRIFVARDVCLVFLAVQTGLLSLIIENKPSRTIKLLDLQITKPVA